MSSARSAISHRTMLRCSGHASYSMAILKPDGGEPPRCSFFSNLQKKRKSRLVNGINSPNLLPPCAPNPHPVPASIVADELSRSGLGDRRISLNTGGKYCNRHSLRSPSSSRTAEKSDYRQRPTGKVGPKPSTLERAGSGSLRDIPGFMFGYWWQVDISPLLRAGSKILLQEDLSITDESDANFTVQCRP
jgi:hypothetical protein